MSNRQDKIARAAAISALSLRTAGKEVTREQLVAYESALHEFDPRDVTLACAQLSTTVKWMPAVAEIIQQIEGVAMCSIEDAAEQAFDVVSLTVSRVGAYKHVDFDDRAVNSAIRSMGGWPQLCDQPTRAFDKWLRKDFVAAYSRACRLGVSDEAGAALPGLSEDGEVTSVDGRIEHRASKTVRVEVNTPANVIGRLVDSAADRKTTKKIESKPVADVPRLDLKKPPTESE